eukprot:jgi/Botrbrau1/21409/Bobra.0216s0028.1
MALQAASSGLQQGLRKESFVIVVGAGIAGLQVGRALQKQEVPFVILEETGEVGGVWRSNYFGYAIQVQSVAYEFPEYPYPKDMHVPWWKFPDGKVVKEYVGRYTDHFGLRSSIRFNTKFLYATPNPSKDGRTGWKVEVRVGGEDGTIETLECSFLVIAKGMNNVPAIPKHYKDLEAFKGTLVVAKQLLEPSQFQGKNVLVIGGNKSAYGVAESVSAYANSTALLFRRAHWVIPYWVLGFLPMFVLYCRFCSWFQPPFYTVKGLDALVHKLLYPLKRCYEYILETSIRLTYGIKGDLVPTMGFFEDIGCPAGLAVGEKFYRAWREGKVKAVLGDVDRFLPNGVQLTDGRRMEGYDVAVLATGYCNTYDWVPPHVEQLLQVQEDGMYLYRHIIPPLVPGLGFVCCEAFSFNSMATAGVQAEWLGRLLGGKMALPSREDQLRDVEALKQWKRRTYLPSPKRGSTLSLHDIYYHDQLLRDMGYPHHVYVRRPAVSNPCVCVCACASACACVCVFV